MLQNKEKVNVDWHLQLQEVSRFTGLMVFMAFAAFLLLSLLTYNSVDPGWRQSQSNVLVLNLGGRFGAFLADALFSMVGHMAYLIAVIPIIRLAQRFKSLKIRNDWKGLSWRFGGLLFIVLSGSVFTHLFDVGQVLPVGPGGAIGEGLAVPLATTFGVFGASLIALLSMMLGLSMSGDISWLGSLDSLGGLILNLFNTAKTKAQSLQFNSKDITNPQINILKPEPSINALASESLAPKKTPLVVLGQKVSLTKEKPISKLKQRIKSVSEAIIEDAPLKKLKIQPFEKKSKGTVSEQGALFEAGELPSLSLLRRSEGVQETGYSAANLEDMSRLLERKLADFGVKIEVVAVSPGPVITRFEFQPAPGVKASKITNLARDLARSLAMTSVRVVEVIPGKSVMGLEVPNENRAMVHLGDVLASQEFQSMSSPLSLALGHDIAGDPVMADVAKMPHLLVAGTTGSGKSVGVNSMLISMLYKSTPDDVRLIMVDPKMLELSVYDGIPHLLTPVITDMKEAANGLRWCVGEMERRYKLLAALGVRNIAGYNKKVLDAAEAGTPIKDPIWKSEDSLDQIQPDLGKLPYIVVVIDEFADMIMVVGKKVEELIARIAQKARAAGIHLILATQRPSVDIITGLIKANVPTRMAFQVSSRIDSRTILDQGGAEQLLGHGDMLYLPPGTSMPIRVHGAFIDDDEVHAVVADWKSKGSPVFIDSITDTDAGGVIPGMPTESDDGEQDALFDEAIAFVTETRKVSISSVQRKLRIGYNRAARLVETMEAAGVVSTPAHNGSREVLAPPPVSR
ncbi:MAG: S-DNA-T family DNA segregation ATPase FtsK/SpoIIIE [Crocinitomicaceae bacterium]